MYKRSSNSANYESRTSKRTKFEHERLSFASGEQHRRDEYQPRAAEFDQRYSTASTSRPKQRDEYQPRAAEFNHHHGQHNSSHSIPLHSRLGPLLYEKENFDPEASVFIHRDLHCHDRQNHRDSTVTLHTRIGSLLYEKENTEPVVPEKSRSVANSLQPVKHTHGPNSHYVQRILKRKMQTLQNKHAKLKKQHPYHQDRDTAVRTQFRTLLQQIQVVQDKIAVRPAKPPLVPKRLSSTIVVSLPPSTSPHRPVTPPCRPSSLTPCPATPPRTIPAFSFDSPTFTLVYPSSPE